MSSSLKPLIVGSRGSSLALAQTRAILHELAAANPDITFEIKIIKTTGDRLSESGAPNLPPGKGIFTAEIEYALLRAEIDLAVHSLKDLPVEMRSDLAIAAIPRRADPRDVLITREPIESLVGAPLGAIIATGSPRRSAQLRHHRPDIQIIDIRGNIDTRLRKLRENAAWTGIVLAKAGLDRLQPDMKDLTLTPLSLDQMLPAPGQGALALQVRANDTDAREVIGKIHDIATAACVAAERGFLAALGGGCSAPVAAFAETKGSALSLRGVCWIGDASEPRCGELSGVIDAGAELGRLLAKGLL